MYGCESWTIKKAEHQRTDAFKLCWRRVLRVPCTSKRSNQSILKEINLDFQYSLEGLMMKLQYFGHMMRRADYLEKTDAGKIEGNKRKGQQRMSWLYNITNSMDMNVNKLWETVLDKRSLACCSPWGHRESDTTYWQNNNSWLMWIQINEEKLNLCKVVKHTMCYTHNLGINTTLHDFVASAKDRTTSEDAHELFWTFGLQTPAVVNETTGVCQWPFFRNHVCKIIKHCKLCLFII